MLIIWFIPSNLEDIIIIDQKVKGVHWWEVCSRVVQIIPCGLFFFLRFFFRGPSWYHKGDMSSWVLMILVTSYTEHTGMMLGIVESMHDRIVTMMTGT